MSKESSRQLALTLHADYHQFYLCDGEKGLEVEARWTLDSELEMMLSCGDYDLIVHAARNTEIPVRFFVHSSESSVPTFDLNQYDAANECDLNVPSGQIAIAGCSDYFPDARRFKVVPGNCRVRILYGNLAQISADGLEGEDFYELHLWPSRQRRPCSVIKKYHSASMEK